MSTAQQPDPTAPVSEQNAVQAIINYTFDLIRAGKSAAEVEASLIERGLATDSARELVEQAFQARAKAVRQLGRKHMAIGAAWCVGGIAVTWGTMAAAHGGGTYVVAWGAIAFGGLEFLWGAWKTATGK